MALTLGASHAASLRNMQYLNQTKSMMDKSLQRISSGKKILGAGDDPGGLALSMQLQSELNVNNAVKSTVENAKSFVEMQDSALATAGSILTEMSALVTKYTDPTLASSKDVYASQFRQLQVQLGNLGFEKFNGVSLFSSESSTGKNIPTSSAGASGGTISIANLDYDTALDMGTGKNLVATTAGSIDYANSSANQSAGEAASISEFVTGSDLTTAMQNISNLRAQSGGKVSALGFASDYLSTKSVTLEAANSRVMDADIAEESLNYSKYSLLYQAGAAALAQSNLSMEVVLDLLKFPSIRT